VPGVLAAATGSDWSSAGSLLTFWFPVGLFVIVAASLYLELSRPHAVPGRQPLAAAGTARKADDAAIQSSPQAAAGPDEHQAPDATP
jgi:hypothetical protein